MKVLDLQCRQGHCFEGWFGSQDDYDTQRAGGLVSCPVCSDSDITKLLSAPRLNLGHAQAPVGAEPVSADSTQATLPAAQPKADAPTHLQGQPTLESGQTLQHLQAAMLQMVRHVLAHTEDVGSRFAEESRKIHYGEREARPIRGQASREEAVALLEEGIAVLPLAVPDALKETLQ